MSRGQAMVEFALVLPVLVLLLVMAIDFGRVYFGWVGLHNAARIAANEAAAAPEAWSGSGDASKQAAYRQMVVNDLNAMNCTAPDGSAWQVADVPNPTFQNQVATADPYENGDHAQVTLDCRFGLITPLASNVLGSVLNIQAAAEFTVRGGIIIGTPTGPPPPAPTPTCTTGSIVPLLKGMTVVEARVAWSVAGFTGTFSPIAGATDSDIVDDQIVSPAALPNSCAAKTSSVVVLHSPVPACSAGEIIVPNLTTITVAQARLKWAAAGFTGSFTPIAGHDTDIVNSQTTSTGKLAGQCSVPTTLVIAGYGTATPSTCTAPELIGDTPATAQAEYTTARFVGRFTANGPNSGTVSSQSLVGGQPYPCTSDMTVQLKK